MSTKNIGKVKQVIGPTVDVEFDSDNLPDIMNALHVADAEKNINLTLEVATHVGDNVVRTVAMASTDGLVRGMAVVKPDGEIQLNADWFAD